MAEPTLKRDPNRQTSQAVDQLDHGRNSDIDAAAEQITTVSMPAINGVLVKAANGNTGTIFLGNSDVTADSVDATDGFELAAGESVFIEIDNANKIYAFASVANQGVYFIAS